MLLYSACTCYNKLSAIFTPPCFQPFFLRTPALVSLAPVSGVSLRLRCLQLLLLFLLVPAFWWVVPPVLMHFSGWLSRLLRCSRFRLVCGVLAVGRSRLGLWRVSVPLLVAAGCGCRFLVRRVRLVCCRRLLSRGASPAPGLALGLRLLLRWGLDYLAPCFWGRYLFPRRGVCRQFQV